jgi:signal transduction histidine kinase/CheY-like chemotaxis protein/HPt (histidine-containing phosphotransfer) domain-containing protein
VSAAVALTPAQLDVEFKLVHAAYVRLRLDSWMSAASVVLFGSLTWSLFPARLMMLWGFVFALNLTAGFVLSASYRRRQPRNSARTLQYWQRCLVTHLAFAGLCWTLGPVLMMAHATGAYVALFASLLLVSCAVATISLAEQQWAMRAFLTTALVPAAAAALWAGGSGMNLVAVVLLVGALAMAVVGRGSSHATRALLETEVRLNAALKLAGAAREEAEQARVESELARARAEAASAAKTRFLATMSHELRTPLNAVIGGAELLRIEHATNAGQIGERIDSIQRSGTHLLGLIENILDLSRIERGDMPLHPEDFDLVECLHSAFATATVLAQVKGLTMRFDVAPGVATARHADAQRLRQVVLNLLGNAVKFTPQGEVSLRLEAGPASLAGDAAAADWVHISVTDSGVGISEAALPCVFDPFHQADQGSNRRFGGSGLGLAIVRLWVEAMGGRVSAQSQLGAGSCFTMALPLPLSVAVLAKRAPRVPSPKPDSLLASIAPASFGPVTPTTPTTPVATMVAAAVSARPVGRHVLVVEDDEINQTIVCGLLRHAGLRVSLAVNGTQAIAALTEVNTIDVVLMDWQMPDIDGLEVTRRLRAGQAGAAGLSVPIIALTANAFAEDRAACLAAGMNDFLTKPVLSADLLAALARATSVCAEAQTEAAESRFGLDATDVVYDPKVLAALPMVTDGSAPEYAQELLDFFISSTTSSVLAIQAAAVKVDSTLMERQLHSLKSASASVGALELAALAASGEATLRKGQMPAADLPSRLLHSFGAFEAAASSQIFVKSKEKQSA